MVFSRVSEHHTRGFSLELFYTVNVPRKENYGDGGSRYPAVAILLDDKKGPTFRFLANITKNASPFRGKVLNPWSVWIILFLIALNVLLITYFYLKQPNRRSLPERSTVRGGSTRKDDGKQRVLVAALSCGKLCSAQKECRRPIIAIFIVGTPVAMFGKT